MDNSYKLNLKERIINQMETIPNKRASFPWLVFKFSGSIAVVALILTATVLYSNRNKPNQSGQAVNLISDPKVRSAILASAYANNPSLQAETRAQEQMSAQVDATVEVAPPIGIGQKAEKQYIHTEALYTKGPQYNNNCNDYYMYNGATPTRINYYSYYNNTDNQETYYSKTVGVDTDNKVVDYRLMVDNREYVYMGGEYAVLLNYPIYNPEPLQMAPAEESKGETSNSGSATIEESQNAESVESELTTETIDADSYPFYGGDESKVEEIIKDGKLYQYLTTSSYTYTCESTQSDVTVITKIWVNADTYELVREETYVGAESPNNLVQSTEYSNETSPELSESEINRLFSFDIDTTVREITISSYDPAQYNADIKTWAKNNPITTLKPSSDFTLNSVSVSQDISNNDPYAYMQDRKFYPKGSLGDKLFESNNKYLSGYEMLSLMSFYSYNTTDFSSINLSIFPQSTNNDDILSRELGVTSDSDTQTTEEIQVLVDNKPVTGTLYLIEYPVVLEKSNSGADVSTTDAPSFTASAVIVSVNGFKMLISGTPGTPPTADSIEYSITLDKARDYMKSLKFTSISSLDQTAFNAYIDSIEDPGIKLLPEEIPVLSP